MWPERLGRSGRWLLTGQRWTWVAPLVGLVLVQRVSGESLQRLTVLPLAAGALLWVVTHPAAGIRLVVTFLPFHIFLMSGLLRLGGPPGVVRMAGFWKEAVVAGVVVGALLRPARRPLDRIDLACLAYVALGAAYALAPQVFVGGELGAQLPLGTRLIGFRSDVFFVLLFVAARHLALSGVELMALVRRIAMVGGVVAALGVLEFVRSELWNRIAVEWFEVPVYRATVLGLDSLSQTDIRRYGVLGGREFVRVGSVLVEYWALAFFLVVVIAIAVSDLTGSQPRRWAVPVLGASLAAVLFTQTRSAFLAVLVVIGVLLLRDGPGVVERSRVRAILLIGALGIAAVPLALGVGFVDRLGGDADSDDVHRDALTASFSLFADAPLGRGLATAAGAGQIAQVEGLFVTESQYLQIATQLGVLGLVLWVAITVMASRGALRAGRDPTVPVDIAAANSAAGAAMVGLAVAGVFLQTMIDINLAWITWLLLGAALGAADRARHLAEPSAGQGVGGRLTVRR